MANRRFSQTDLILIVFSGIDKVERGITIKITVKKMYN